MHNPTRKRGVSTPRSKSIGDAAQKHIEKTMIFEKTGKAEKNIDTEKTAAKPHTEGGHLGRPE